MSAEPITELSEDEVVFHPRSYFDETGRVFWWREGLYRVIYARRATFVRELFSSGLVARLVERGLLVDTKIAPVTLGGCLVLSHRVLPFVSAPYEWSPEMLRDAGLLILRLERELEEHGVMLQDAHSGNVLFDGPKPVWVDFGSLVPLDRKGVWPAADEFHRFFINPLILHASGHDHVANWLVRDDASGVRESDLGVFMPSGGGRSALRTALRRSAARAPGPLKAPLRRAVSEIRSRRAEERQRAEIRGAALIESLETKLKSLDLARAPGTWTNYHDTFPALEPGPDWSVKRGVVDAVLDRLAPATVLDFAGNHGWFSVLAAGKGAQVVTTDTDEAAVADLYVRSRAESLPILPLVVDFRHAAHGFGVASPATERLASELVLVLALVHHLVFTYRFTFEAIVDTFAALTTRYLLIEFIPPDDQYVREWSPESRPWYTLDQFTELLAARFDTIEVLPSSPSPRVLVLCSRESS